MSEPTTTTGPPPTPGEAAAAQRQDEASAPVPGAEAGAASAAPVVDPGAAAAVASAGPAAPGAGPAVDPLDATVVLPLSPGEGWRTDGEGAVEIECPGCGLLLIGDAPRPTAAWFCPRCDFPAFWATPPEAGSTPPAQERRARRRLPGTGGRAVLGAAPCWHCGEMSEPDATVCVRCAATLPKPDGPTPEPVTVTVEVPTPVPYPLPGVVWPFVVAAVLAGAAAAMAGTLAVLHLVGALS